MRFCCSPTLCIFLHFPLFDPFIFFHTAVLTLAFLLTVWRRNTGKRWGSGGVGAETKAEEAEYLAARSPSQRSG